MQELRTPEDLIQWLERNAPRPCIRRAVTYGTVVNYGFFGKCGFVVLVRSRVSPTTWVLAVLKGHGPGTYGAFLMDAIPWEFYEGGKCKLFAGDVPTLCRSNQIAAMSAEPPQKRNWIHRFLDWFKRVKK